MSLVRSPADSPRWIFRRSSGVPVGKAGKPINVWLRTWAVVSSSRPAAFGPVDVPAFEGLKDLRPCRVLGHRSRARWSPEVPALGPCSLHARLHPAR
jgi:hypothetical protein